MTVLACVSKNGKLSGCQYVCDAQKFDLVFNIAHIVCQRQSILYSVESHQVALYYHSTKALEFYLRLSFIFSASIYAVYL